MGSWLQKTFCWFCARACWLAMRLFFRLRTYDLANVPKRGGLLILSNHQSFLDPMLVGCSGPRCFHFMARHTLFRNKLIRGILMWVNAFPVERGRADRAAIRTAIERLAAGGVVVMFPEGTRTTDGELQPMKGGFRLLVRRAKVSVLPVVVDGAFKAWPRSQKLPRPSPVSVIYGQSIPSEEFDNLSDDEAAERIQREMAALLAELRRKRATSCQG